MLTCPLMNRTDRLVAMVTYLQGRRVVKAEELAEHFEVSVRTVYRDVAALSESGVPVVGEAGIGYSLVKGYHLPPVMFTTEEAMALAVGEGLVKHFTDQSLAGPISSALLKIRSILSREHQDGLDRLAHGTAIEERLRWAPGFDQRLLLPIQQAVVARRMVRLQYRDRAGRTTQREVEPLGVVYYGDAWYLVCWCRLRSDYRHFKLARITGLEVLNERFTPRPDFMLREHLCDHREATARARVRFAAAVMDRVRRDASAAMVTEETLPDGGHVVTFRTYSFDWMARWLLSFGPDAEVLDPPELRELITDQARAVLEKYARLTVS